MRSRAGTLAAAVLACGVWTCGTGLTRADPREAAEAPAAYEGRGWGRDWRPHDYGDRYWRPRWRDRDYGYPPRHETWEEPRWRRPYRYGERNDRGYRTRNWRPYRYGDRYAGGGHRRDYGRAYDDHRYQAPLAYSPRAYGWRQAPRWGWREL